MIIHLQVQHFNKSGRLGESLAFRTQLRHDLQSGGQNKIVSTWLNNFAKKRKKGWLNNFAHVAGNLQRGTLQRRVQGRRRRSLNGGGELDKPARLTIVPDCQIRYKKQIVRQWHCPRWTVKLHWWASSPEVWAVAMGSPTGTPGCPSTRSGSPAFKRKVGNWKPWSRWAFIAKPQKS